MSVWIDNSAASGVGWWGTQKGLADASRIGVELSDCVYVCVCAEP